MKVRADLSFKGRQFTAEVTLWAVRWYLMFSIGDQSTDDLVAALDRLQDRFDQSIVLLHMSIDLLDRDDAEAQQQWRIATTILRSSWADGMRGHMRMTMALVREIQCKTVELRRRFKAETISTGCR